MLFSKRINKNPIEGLKWLKLSASNGVILAQRSIGTCYHNGDYVPKNYIEAAKWYDLAATQGDADSQLYLGKMYAAGQGVEQNYVEAYKWINLASSHNPEAKKLLRILENFMTNTEINKAQRLSSESQTPE